MLYWTDRLTYFADGTWAKCHASGLNQYSSKRTKRVALWSEILPQRECTRSLYIPKCEYTLCANINYCIFHVFKVFFCSTSFLVMNEYFCHYLCFRVLKLFIVFDDFKNNCDSNCFFIFFQKPSPNQALPHKTEHTRRILLIG